MPRPVLNLTRRRFGSLVAEKRERRRGKDLWRCKCDCGKIVWHTAGDLIAGRMTSCGCMQFTWRQTPKGKKILQETGRKVAEWKKGAKSEGDL